MQANTNNPAAKKKISAAMIIRNSDPEYKKKIGQQSASRWADPDYKKRVSEAIKLGKQKRKIITDIKDI